jgi:hypothetical protein
MSISWRHVNEIRPGATVLAMLLSLAGREAHAQPLIIGMPFNDFRKALDGKIQNDTTDKTAAADTTAVCTKKKDAYSCTFHDAGFQRSVAAFEKLGVLGGRFQLKMKMVVDTADGKVSRISVTGVRSDPVNLFQFYGTVVNIMQISDPEVGAGKGESEKLAEKLGVMRGDDADDIGKAHTDIEPYAEIKCLSQNSHISTAVECVFTPKS